MTDPTRRTAGPSPSGGPGPEPGWDQAWAEALDALELDVTAAEQMLTMDHIADDPPRDPWAPPAGLGPLPLALADRARAVLDRQLEVGRRLAEAADLSRRHSRAAQALRSAPPAAPVYLDTPA
ncbi:hypothetical protein [Cellulomonas bogoriensis]|uniref:Uncharacterized protein n=1 Tax=Cellulomonas bogoriensis 69B4 = DSM 16987 TaxID=1386082 RepID=A0A0A0BSZ7_9CELL|nr:hypothetical protein [Cellulomonas bogoriensis]KGM10239.1 hypothetical protein N869_12150 [Cellulomonas bogoriensis 69B4 = DSM 16987]